MLSEFVEEVASVFGRVAGDDSRGERVRGIEGGIRHGGSGHELDVLQSAGRSSWAGAARTAGAFSQTAY